MKLVKSIKKRQKKGDKKRKSKQVLKRKPESRRLRDVDEEIASDDNVAIESNERDVDIADFEDEDLAETENERHHRMALQYIEKIKSQAETSDNTDQYVTDKLQLDYLERLGRLDKPYASRISPKLIATLTGHRRCVTCVQSTPDGRYVFSCAKDGSIIKYDAHTAKRLHTFPRQQQAAVTEYEVGSSCSECLGHSTKVNCLAISFDNQFLATGDAHGILCIWNVESCALLKVFKAHIKSITGITIRPNSFQLFTCSEDKSLKIFDLENATYVETLYQHDDIVTSVDSLVGERCVSVGGQDGTMRLWKVPEESHLIFRTDSDAFCVLDCVSVLNEKHAVTGDQSGTIALWSFAKRKPLFTVDKAHTDSKGNVTPISAIKAARSSDFIVSGSNNGLVHIWTCSIKPARLVVIKSIEVNGFVNSIYISEDYNHLYLACGKEHRLGRWWYDQSFQNCVCHYSLL